VTSSGKFMYFSRELRKWSSLTEAAAVNSWFTGVAIRCVRCSLFSELIIFGRDDVKLVLVASLTLET